jgi:hypothetical protein
VEERTDRAVDQLVAGLDAHRTGDDEEERRLPHGVVAERLAWPQLDEDGPLGALPRMKHHRRPRAVRCLDLGKPPMPHEWAFPAPVWR